MARDHAQHTETKFLTDSRQRIQNEKVSFSEAEQHRLSQECFGGTQTAKASVREGENEHEKTCV